MSENVLLIVTLDQEYQLSLPEHATFTQEATFCQLDPNTTEMFLGKLHFEKDLFGFCMLLTRVIKAVMQRGQCLLN